MFVYFLNYINRSKWPVVAFIAGLIGTLFSIILTVFIYKTLYLYDPFFSYLEEYIKTFEIIIEDAKGSIDLYFIDENKKLKKYKSYPIEMFITYDASLHIDDFNILDELIKNRFANCKVTRLPKECNMWSPSHKGVESGFLRGETFSGVYSYKDKKGVNKHINFKFIYFIQHADGYNLETIDKAWPALNRVLKGNPTSMKHHALIRLNLIPKTLKVRIGNITDLTTKGELLINYYLENFKLKPMLFISYENKTKYQLITVDLPMNNYYVDVFYRYNKYNKNKTYAFDINSFKTLYKMERVLYMREWYNRWYNKYDS